MYRVYEIDMSKDCSGINGFRDEGENNKIYKDNLIVYGGSNFISFIKDELNEFIDGDNDVFYLDDLYKYVGGNTDKIVLDCLEKKTKKRGYVGYFNGYSQSDVVKVFYTDKISNDDLIYMSDLYFCKLKEFRVYSDDMGIDYYVEMITDKEYYNSGMSYTDIFRDRLNDKDVIVNLFNGYDYTPIYKTEKSKD